MKRDGLLLAGIVLLVHVAPRQGRHTSRAGSQARFGRKSVRLADDFGFDDHHDEFEEDDEGGVEGFDIASDDGYDVGEDVDPSGQSQEDDEEEEDEDEDLDFEFVSGAGSINKRLSTGIAGLRSMVPNPNEMKGALVKAKARARDLLREVKGAHSSEFECAVVKGTRPDDQGAKDKHVSRLIDSVATFPMAMAARDAQQSDYYQMMLHKLWSRMIEPDWRTKAKAVYIFHRMAVSLDPELHTAFVLRFDRMRRGKHKRSKTNYYDMVALTQRISEDAPRRFLKSYAAYVLERFKKFSGSFEELHFREEDPARSAELARALRGAQRLINRASSIEVAAEVQNEAALQCLHLVISDCFVTQKNHDSLWDIVGDKLGQLMDMQRRKIENGEQLSASEIQNMKKLCEWAMEAPDHVRSALQQFSRISFGIARVAAVASREAFREALPTREKLRRHLKLLADPPST